MQATRTTSPITACKITNRRRKIGQSPYVRRLASGEGMIEKLVSLDELGPHWKAIRPFRRASVMDLAGIAALLLFISETVGTTQELPTATRGTAPVPFDQSGANSSGSYHAPIDRSDPIGIGDSAGATPVRQTSPGQWLIDDVARARAKLKVKQASPNPIPNHPPSSESRAGTKTTEAEDGKLGAPSSQGSVKRSDDNGASTRPNTSRGPHDATTSCLEAPAGPAPQGRRWYYRLDRETQRKCWYVRARG